MKKDYEKEIKLYEQDFRCLNLFVNPSIDKFLTGNFLDMIDRIKKYKLPSLHGKSINTEYFEDLKNIFKEIILLLEDKDIIDYFTNRVEIIDIIPVEIDPENALLDVDMLYDRYFIESIILPNTPIRELTVSLFSHEMGHIPLYEQKLSTIQENFGYTEALSMFMEYLTFIKFRGNEGEEYFIRNRLIAEKKELLKILKLNKRYNSKNASDVEKTWLMYEMMDYEKYLSSLDLTLQLIELLKKDRTEVIKALKYVVIGDSSMEEVSRKFSLDTSEYKSLTKEFSKRIDRK